MFTLTEGKMVDLKDIQTKGSRRMDERESLVFQHRHVVTEIIAALHNNDMRFVHDLLNAYWELKTVDHEPICKMNLGNALINSCDLTVAVAKQMTSENSSISYRMVLRILPIHKDVIKIYPGSRSFADQSDYWLRHLPQDIKTKYEESQHA